MATLFRHLLLVAALLFSLAGHGVAMAQGPEPHPVTLSAHALAMHQGADDKCDAGQPCPAAGQWGSCCMIGHCLAAVMAEGTGPLPAFRPALPVPAYAIAAFAVPQDTPERPPRIA